MERIIWTMWWQGEQNAPLPVQVCLASIRHHAVGAEVRVLDQDTYQQYVTLPDHIMEKVSTGQITLTHLSDIIRFRLLRDYGGLWMDSTIFVKDDIPDSVFDRDFYTLRHNLGPGEEQTDFTGGGWTLFLMGGSRGNQLFRAICRMHEEYWSSRTDVVLYLMADLYIRQCCDASAAIREMVDEVPLYDGDMWDLLHRRNEAGELSEVQGRFQKMNWRLPCVTSCGGGVKHCLPKRWRNMAFLWRMRQAFPVRLAGGAG